MNTQNFVEQVCNPPLRQESDAVVIENIVKYRNKTPAEIMARMNQLEAVTFEFVSRR